MKVGVAKEKVGVTKKVVVMARVARQVDTPMIMMRGTTICLHTDSSTHFIFKLPFYFIAK